VITICVVYLFDNKLADLPPLGKFFDPFHGYLALHKSDQLPGNDLSFDALLDSVNVTWDERRIPHIFANNEHDLFFVQGYIHAFDRLWQMEFQVMAAGGRLSEIIGIKALDYDRFQRRLGMMRGAENVLDFYQSDPSMLYSLQAYTDGINAYINSLDPEQYPIEYKLLDYSPEKWTIKKCALLYMYMAWELSGSTNDLAHTKFLKEYGIADYRDLYSFDSPLLSPIMPRETKWDFDPIEIDTPENIYMSDPYGDGIKYQPNPNNGSNNFVVSGDRSKTGLPILANDPHLNLTLPSIWYENHLITPEFNTYGVSLLGAPCVVIGYNKDIAWGSTNGMNDVMDFYDITFKDETKMEYLHDGEWKQISLSIEKIKIRDSETLLDTTYMTHHGPIMSHDIFDKMPRFGSSVSVGRAMKWLASEPSMEPKTFYLLNKAKNYDDYLNAISYFNCPGQNIIFASSDNNIAIWQTNKLIPKWDLQGRFIMDGSDSEHDWKNKLPIEHQPHSLNPDRGYLSSANQNPVDKQYPYFVPGDFAPLFRGARIDHILEETHSATYKDLQNIQNDNKSLLAKRSLPLLLEILNQESLTEDEMIIYNQLSEWDYFYNPDSKMPVLFDLWMKNISTNTWKDELGNADEDVEWPNFRILSDLIEDSPNSKWFDNINTNDIEDLSTIATEAFEAASNKLLTELGSIGEKWKWKNFRGTDVYHLAKVPGFGRMHLPTGGDWNIPNATALTHGPSWRYVVELGDRPKGYGIYPGGQSGFPGSIHYDQFLDSWVKGHLYELNFPYSKEEVNGHAINFIPRRSS
jgi:penicillin amidase